MVRMIKLYHKEIYPEGAWRMIAKESEKVNDDDIYYYVDEDFDLGNIKVGDTIQLDEKFKVVDIA